MKSTETISRRRPNRLIDQKSPYLLQHAHNPVDWYPWGDEAFQKAQQENKPVFLSIGYSTCHWCHVMERESFEDEEVALLLNSAFIPVKVDREERPDIDHLYMNVCQMLTGKGGWPLTIIMTPDKKPFFAATYLPKKSRFNMPGMMKIIPQVQDLWENRKSVLISSADKIIGSLQNSVPGESGKELDSITLEEAFHHLSRSFDPSHGGFSRAPKFPAPHNLLFLLRHWNRTGNDRSLEMVEKTLKAMRLGGIFDQIGFGFHRYSTDSRWLVPHFEKMLYDQALLAMAYTEAYLAAGSVFYKSAAEDIFTYVLRDLTSPEGGFYSAEDADSEGVEGKYYVWTWEEVHRILSPEEAELAVRVYSLSLSGNFTDEAGRQNTGVNILHFTESMDELSSRLGIAPEGLQARIKRIDERLYEHRKKRVPPLKDDKILTDWNGLMIAALSKAASAFGNDDLGEAAESAASFILHKMRLSEGQLLHRYRDGEAAITGYADDYAFMIWGLLELYLAKFNPQHLKDALDLNEYFIDHFWDDKQNGFFFTSDHGEKLFQRNKPVYDGAVPSSNSVALSNLVRLSKITGRSELEEKAALLRKHFAPSVAQHPSAYTKFMCGLDLSLGPAHEIVIVGRRNSGDTESMLEAVRRAYLPQAVMIFVPSDDPSSMILDISPFTREQKPVDGKATAYVCRDYACQQPTTDPKKMMGLIAKELQGLEKKPE